MWLKASCASVILGLLAGCASTPAPVSTQPAKPATTTPQTTINPPASAPLSASTVPAGRPSLYECNYNPSRVGGFYKDDGPLALPDNLNQVLEPLPRAEPLHRFANNPYNVLGQSFVPRKVIGDYTGRGIGSWYGSRFNGKKTSSGEIYDMFQMTAAHPTLPIPSYARVTNLKNQRSVIVRINDRGPFLKGREIDLSFLAACRLGYAMNGSAEVEVVSLLPGEPGSESPATIAAAGDHTQVAESPLPAALPLTTTVPHSEPVTGGVYLQLGAFGSRANAENFHAHLARELDEQQVARLAIQSSGNLHRVRLGPFADRAAAQAEAERLTGKKNLPAVISR